MSIHSSLRGISTLVGERSVHSRAERIATLQKQGKFDPEKRSPYGLPKVRTRFKVAGAKKAKAEKPAAGAVAGAPGAAPAPAAAAAPAAAPAKPEAKGAAKPSKK